MRFCRIDSTTPNAENPMIQVLVQLLSSVVNAGHTLMMSVTPSWLSNWKKTSP